MLDQQRNVFLALTQRGQFDMEYVQPVEKVGPERALFDHVFEVLVGGGHASEIDFDDLIPADAGDLALLQYAQQIGLRLQADVADLVEKNRAAFGDFELAFLAVLRR